jgi:glucokinase
LIGDSYVASEIGHLSLFQNGRPCACGLRGCIETVVSGPGILEAARELLRKNTLASKFASGQEFTTQDVLEAAIAADPLALEVVTQAARTLGFVVALYTATFNPGCTIIGGGVGRASFEFLLPVIEHELALRVPKTRYQNMQIKKSTLASSAIGASCLVRYQKSLGT